MLQSQELDDEALDFCQKKSSVGPSILSVSLDQMVNGKGKLTFVGWCS